MRPGWPRHFVTNPELRFGVLGQSTPTLADLDGDGTPILLGLTRDPPDQVLVLEWPMVRQDAAHHGALPVAR